MNFNIDDPLAELLSDNSIDYDSFFDNPSGGGSKKATIATNKSKGKTEELLGIKEEMETIPSPIKRQNTVTNNLTYKGMTTSTPRITKQKPSQSNDDDDDDLGFDPKTPKTGAKINLFDDLLGTIDMRRPATAAATTTRREDAVRPTMSRQSTDTTTDNSNLLLSQTRPKTSIGRRSSGNSTMVNTDPLGIFSGQSKDKEVNASTSGMSTPMAMKRGPTANWLGLSTELEEPHHILNVHEDRTESAKALQSTKTEAQEDFAEVLKIPDTQNYATEHVTEMEEVNVGKPYNLQEPTTNTAQHTLLLNSVNMGAKSSLNTLQLQESQLVLASYMKNHERTFLDMQRKQESLLQHQERQFVTLLDQQMQRQVQMEENIKLQQERINSYIQLLMTQPVSVGLFDGHQDISGVAANEANIAKRSEQTTHTETVALEMVHMEVDTKRLEFEKLRLEELVENTRKKYEIEIELIEASYKKQIKVLEEHLTAIESMLQTDVEDQKLRFNLKIEALEDENRKLRVEYESNISTLKQDHEDELRRIRKSQQDDLEMVNEEHKRMLETIRQSKILEFAAVQENTSYLQTLKLASNNLENLSGGFQDLRDEMQMKIETLHRDREKKLEARERKLEDAEKRLQFTEETSETERIRLIELVSTLEFQLNKLSKETANENWMIRQKMASLDAEKVSFEREKEYTREQMLRDEKRIADLKEMQLAETKRAMVELQEDRARLVLEGAKIETEKKLRGNNNMDNERLEIEAQLQVAQDSIRQADSERERYYKMHRQMDQKKRELLEKENLLCAKDGELEQELCSLRLLERKSQDMQEKARFAEQNFLKKMQSLQQVSRELAEKETNLSQERALLAQERISLHSLRLKLSERKCALCKIDAKQENFTQLLNTELNDTRDNMGTQEIGTVVPGFALQSGTDIVELMLDENIRESYRKMKSTNAKTFVLTDAVLDDDSKKLAIHKYGSESVYGGYDLLNKIIMKD